MNYFWLTVKHKWFVFLACLKLKVSLKQAILHDMSKFSEDEYPFYQRYFFGDIKDKTDFDIGWNHHWMNNPHHWEYWQYSRVQGYIPPLDMPEKFIREMIADWMGAGRAYKGSWDIKEWLTKNFPTMKLSPATRVIVQQLVKQNLGFDL